MKNVIEFLEAKIDRLQELQANTKTRESFINFQEEIDEFITAVEILKKHT